MRVGPRVGGGAPAGASWADDVSGGRFTLTVGGLRSVAAAGGFLSPPFFGAPLPAANAAKDRRLASRARFLIRSPRLKRTQARGVKVAFAFSRRVVGRRHT